jgi:general L-amino acid transport system permease protein
LGVYLLLGSPLYFEHPTLQGFNFSGGLSFSPEFLALVLALSIYTATYISEAIRAGIESVDNGQKGVVLHLFCRVFYSKISC